jgi:hypothetical protein
MLKYPCRIIAVLSFVFSFSAKAQQGSLSGFTPDPVKVQMFSPYLAAHYGGQQGLEALKSSDRFLYFRELWYFTESFSIVRNHLSQGITLDESIIDISRFEGQRKYDEEVIVILPGFKDALKLMPGKQLLHKPDYAR